MAGCGGPAGTGNGQFGAAPATGVNPTGSPTPAPSESRAPTSTGSPTPTPTASSASGAADLRASYKVDKGPLGAKSTVGVRITNEGTGESGWTVTIVLSGLLTLQVTPGPHVNHEARDGKHVFTPSDVGQILGPGDLLEFSFSVTGLSDVTSCMINDRACTAA